MAHRYKLSDYRSKRIEEASIVVELDDGTDITIPPADCWPDKLPRGGEALFRAVLGDDQFDRYIAAGGTMKLLDSIVADATKATVPES